METHPMNLHTLTPRPRATQADDGRTDLECEIRRHVHALERGVWKDLDHRGQIVSAVEELQREIELREQGLDPTFAAACRAADARFAPASPAAPAAPKEKPPSPLPLVNMTTWDGEPVPDQDWAVVNRIPRRQCVLFSGEGSAGKSTAQLHLSAAHVLGRD
jgi:hypothetical protein